MRYMVFFTGPIPPGWVGIWGGGMNLKETLCIKVDLSALTQWGIGVDELVTNSQSLHFASNSFGPIDFVLEHFRLGILFFRPPCWPPCLPLCRTPCPTHCWPIVFFVSRHVCHHVGHLVHLHVGHHFGHHNVASALCEGSETLTE